jgi:hypothetical protein
MTNCFDRAPNEQARISGADFADVCDGIEYLRKRNKELERLREQKPAQEIPAELVAWANSWQEDDSDMPSYLVGCNDMKHFVKSQLGKMKGGA